MKVKQAITHIGILLFPLLLPLPLPLNIKSSALICFCVTLLPNLQKEAWSLKKIKPDKLVIIFALLFLLDPLITLVRNEGLSFHEVRLSFIGLPLLFLVSRTFLLHFRDKIYKAFILGIYIYIAYAVVYVIYFYSQSVYHTIGVDYYLKYVLYNYMPGAIHHTYLGLYICFAMLLLLHMYGFTRRAALFIVPLLLAVFIIGSKLSIGVALFIVILKITPAIVSIKHRVLLITAFIAVGSVMIVFLLKETDLFRTIDSGIKTRKHIYECSLYAIQDNYALGVGNNHIKDVLEECLSRYDIGRMDTHNIFLQEFLSNGVLGLAAILWLFAFLFLRAGKNALFRLFLTVVLIFGMIEHVLDLQNGATFFIFFILLLYYTEVSGTRASGV